MVSIPHLNLAGATLAALLLAAAPAQAALTLSPDPPGPQPAGTPVTWTAAFDGHFQYTYRFSVAFLDVSADLHVVRDYATDSTFVWAPVAPGRYRIAVTVRRVGGSTDLDFQDGGYDITNPAGSGPVVRPTEHPLVRLYAAPPCSDPANQVALEIQRSPEPRTGDVSWRAIPQGQRMDPPGMHDPPLEAAPWQTTTQGQQLQAGSLANPWEQRVVKPCRPTPAAPSRGVCFWVAGLRADTTYLARHVELTPSGEIPSVPVRFRTGPAAPHHVATCSPSIPWTGATGPPDPYLLVSPPPESDTPVPFAVDMSGQLVWYDDGPDREGEVALVTTINDDGAILELVSSGGVHDQILREIDPVGHAVRQTSVPRINAQLTAMGAPDTITAFFHEAIRFPDGKTLVGCTAERMLEGVQGIPAGSPEDVVGNVIVSLDEDWQVVWYWDAFQDAGLLDRAAVLGERCGDQTPGCPPLQLASVARDWTHGNCIVPMWETGDLLYSLRHQDWIVGIDYDHGAGGGSRLVQIGPGGNVPLSGGGLDDWFTHQHGLAPLDDPPGGLLVFDNGNTRCEGQGPDCHSRGQVLQVIQGNATLLSNVDLGEYSEARGMSQRLDGGDLHYVLGTLGTPLVPRSRAVQLDASGTETFAIECTTWAYRMYRLRSLEAPRRP